LPKGVTVNVGDGSVAVEGPKGKLAINLPPSISVSRDAAGLHVVSDAPGAAAPRLQGLARALVANLVHGAAVGYSRTLELQGTGYRAELKGRTLTVRSGAPTRAWWSCRRPSRARCRRTQGDHHRAVVAEQALLGQICATIRRFRPAEPYGGKGVRFKGEQVRRKAGKAGKGRK
jgi:large subunit ribosomal protein L6